MWRYLKRVLIGKPLKTLDEGQTHLTKFKALAMLSSDAISSVAYGPEQITTVLVTLSAAAIWYSIPIADYPCLPKRWRGLRGCYPQLGKQRGPGCRGISPG